MTHRTRTRRNTYRVLAGAAAALATIALAWHTTDSDDEPAHAPDLHTRIDTLRVADEHYEGYDRDLFPHWDDLDGNGCDARDDVLAAESQPPGVPCHDLEGGTWHSLFDDTTLTDPSEVSIDHMIPLAEAWRSGAHAWDTDRRRAFANDITHPDTLIAVTPASNTAKSDQDPADWMPPAPGTACRYTRAWVTVKETWNLTVDTDERDALHAQADTCDDDNDNDAARHHRDTSMKDRLAKIETAHGREVKPGVTVRR